MKLISLAVTLFAAGAAVAQEDEPASPPPQQTQPLPAEPPRALPPQPAQQPAKAMQPTFTQGAALKPWTLNGPDAGGSNEEVSVEAGWPGLSLGYTRPLSLDADIGLRIDTAFAPDGAPDATNFAAGLRVPLRWTAERIGSVSLLFRADPGLFVVTSSPTQLALRLPISAVVGAHLAGGLVASLALEAPLSLYVKGSPRTALVTGILPGAMLEYPLDRQLALSLNVQAGPLFSINYFGSQPLFSFKALLGLSYRI